jgi:uncharacterized protein (DUF697 family)
MAKRPQFNLPSTKPAAEPANTEWVYRSDRPAAVPDPPPDGPSQPFTSEPYRIIARYSRYAAAAGLIPLPGLGVVASGGVQLRMIAELCAHYGVPFSSQLGRSIVATLVGTVARARMAISLVPVLGIVTGPGLGYTATWAIGRVFIRHFESGGTLSNFRASGLPPDRVDA